MIHNFCQGLTQVGSGCDGSSEACDVVCHIVKRVTLLVVNGVALCCASGTF